MKVMLKYRAHFEFGEGIFLYAGTGSIAIYMTETGKVVRAGGWGYLLAELQMPGNLLLI